MTPLDWVALVVVVAVLGYLLLALLRSDRAK